MGCKDCDGISTRGMVHEHATIHESTHDHVVDGVDAQAISHAAVVPKVEQHLALHSNARMKIDGWMGVDHHLSRTYLLHVPHLDRVVIRGSDQHAVVTHPAAVVQTMHVLSLQSAQRLLAACVVDHGLTIGR